MFVAASSALADFKARKPRSRNSAHRPRPAMSNPNGLPSKKLCHCLDQGRIL